MWYQILKSNKRGDHDFYMLFGIHTTAYSYISFSLSFSLPIVLSITLSFTHSESAYVRSCVRCDEFGMFFFWALIRFRSDDVTVIHDKMNPEIILTIQEEEKIKLAGSAIF